MRAADILIPSGVIVGAACFAMLLGLGLRRMQPAWSPRRIAFLSSLLLPSMAVLLPIYVFVSVLLRPASQCGTDACGMAGMAALFGVMVCLLAFVVGFVATFLSQLIGRR